MTGSFCNNGNVSLDLAVKPPTGLNLVQLQNHRPAQQRTADLRGHLGGLQLEAVDALLAAARRDRAERAARRAFRSPRGSRPARDGEFEMASAAVGKPSRRRARAASSP